MDLLEIESWLRELIFEKSLSDLDPKSDPFLKKINDHSYSELNESLKNSINSIEDLFIQSDFSFYGRSIQAYYHSWNYSKQLLKSPSTYDSNTLLLEWFYEIDRCLNDDFYDHHILDKAVSSLHSYISVKELEADEINKYLWLSDQRYDHDRKVIYNEIVDFISLFIRDGRLTHQNNDKAFVASESSSLIKCLNWIDEATGLDTLYPMNDDLYWPNFWYSKMLLEKVHRDTNNHPGGRPSKLEKDLNADIKEFCLDVDKVLNECLEAEKINTWKVAGELIKFQKYEDYFQDSLYKFIESVFESAWFEFDSELDLSQIVKFKKAYYLPKN